MSKPHDNGLNAAHEESARKGAFRLGEGAEMLYRRPDPYVMDVHHTWVDERYRGQGMAQQLFGAMIEYARQHQRRVIPTCPFVERMFEQHPQYADVL